MSQIDKYRKQSDGIAGDSSAPGSGRFGSTWFTLYRNLVLSLFAVTTVVLGAWWVLSQHFAMSQHLAAIESKLSGLKSAVAASQRAPSGGSEEAAEQIAQLREQLGTMDERTAVTLRALDVKLSSLIESSKQGPGNRHPSDATLLPIGTILAFAGSLAPDGWMRCEGQLLDATSFPELHEAMGQSSKATIRLPTRASTNGMRWIIRVR